MDGVTRTYNAANQLVDDGTDTLTYDDKGNLTNDGTNAYTWDRANRLLSMGGISYQYNGAGNRISRDNGVDVTQYLLDLQPGLSVVLSETQGASVTRYVHSRRGIHAQEDASGNWAWMVQDGLGSVRGVVDDALDVLWTGNPAPYGEYFSETGTRQSPYLFTGEYTDPITALVHLRARDYAPGLGVFASLDPAETRNRYAYASANPVNLVDSSGLIGELPNHWADCIGHPVDSLDQRSHSDLRRRFSRRRGLNFQTSQKDCEDKCFWRRSGLITTLLLGEDPAYTACIDGCRCNQLGEKREQLRASALSGCERLVNLIEYAVEQFDYEDTVRLSDDISCALTNARGPHTVILAALKFDESLILGSGGWLDEYDDDTTNQAFHLWSNLNTTAQGGSWLQVEIGNYAHECRGIGRQYPDPETSIEDVRLTNIGLHMGYAIRQGVVQPNQLAEFVRLTVCEGGQPFPFTDEQLGIYSQSDECLAAPSADENR